MYALLNMYAMYMCLLIMYVNEIVRFIFVFVGYICLHGCYDVYVLFDYIFLCLLIMYIRFFYIYEYWLFIIYLCGC